MKKFLVLAVVLSFIASSSVILSAEKSLSAPVLTKAVADNTVNKPAIKPVVDNAVKK
jgi:hypothetical protein